MNADLPSVWGGGINDLLADHSSVAYGVDELYLGTDN